METTPDAVEKQLEELYDLKTDPEQTPNLIEDTADGTNRL